MYNKSIFFAIIFSLLSFNLSNAQSNLLNAKVPQEVGQMNEQQIEAENVTPVEYGYVDDRDILWSKIVYEKIDLSERLNFPLLFPIDDNQYVDTRKSLWRVLKENIINKNITLIYNANNDNFKELLTYDQAMASLKISKNYGDENDPDFQTIEITSADITGYYLKVCGILIKEEGS